MIRLKKMGDAQKEMIFNVYAIVEDNIIREVAIRSHQVEGTDEEKGKYLEKRVEEDWKKAERYKLPESFIYTDFFNVHSEDFNMIPYGVYKNIMGTNYESQVYKNALAAKGAPNNPLVCRSIVINNKILADAA
ncbi:MAG: hypothetical protein GY754_38530 [bacterium]|nr:hypothetical protein [bacterium]